MPAGYDEDLTAQYLKSLVQNWRPYVENYLFLRLMGDIAGREVLDLGCGQGYYSRQFKERGAARVVGIDISDAMIRLARASEEQQPLGIEYLHGDIADMETVGSFDLATAAQVLHYAPSQEHLGRMCRRIHANLKPGGRFVGVVGNLEMDPARLGPLNTFMRILPPDPLREGDRVTIEVNMGTALRVDIFYWKRSTYEQAFGAAGFVEFQWYRQEVHPQADEVLGPEIAQTVRENSPGLFFSCIRSRL